MENKEILKIKTTSQLLSSLTGGVRGWVFFFLLLALPSLMAQSDSLQVNTSSVEAPLSHGGGAGGEVPSKAEADSAYAHEDFAKAAQIYQSLLAANGGSAQLYFNLGNCYYRQDSIARAILCYERARLLDPSDDDVRFNLEMARSKTVDRVMPANDMFFVSLFNSLVRSLSIHSWTWIAILCFILMLVAIAGYLFLPSLAGKKTGFAVAIIALLVCIFANIAANQQLHQMENRTNAVIMAPSVVVKSTPSTSGTDLFILHEGTRVGIVDDSMNEWMEISMSDGKQGWIHRSEAEVI